MYKKDLFWYTEYPTIPYLEIPVAPNLGIIAAVVRDRHASIIVERIHPENFKACSHKYDLSADDPQRRGVACAVIPDATAYKIPYLPEMGVGTIIQESVREDFDTPATARANRPGSNVIYQSWKIDELKFNKLQHAVKNYKERCASGRYRYVMTGGIVGWLATLPGSNGVNCADFVVKILKEIGIKDFGPALYRDPNKVFR